MKRTFFIAVLGALVGVVQAAEREVRVDVLMAAVPRGQALPLASLLLRPETFADAEARLRAMIASGEAELLGWPMVRFVDKPANSASVEEVRYPTEFSPPQLPQSIGNMGAADWMALGILPFISRTPTAFDARECGPTLDLENAVVDQTSRSLALNVSAKLTWLEEMESPPGARHPVKGQGPRLQPRFAVLRQSARLVVADGGGMLLGRFVEAFPRSRIVFFLLHANSRPLPPP